MAKARSQAVEARRARILQGTLPMEMGVPLRDTVFWPSGLTLTTTVLDSTRRNPAFFGGYS